MNGTVSSSSFLGRYEFLLRRLHSLTGLAPIGAYMVVHLLVNASVLSGPTVFQKNVYQIHSLEDALVLVEWAFIFLPILFHGLLGVAIVVGGSWNAAAYPYGANIRYVLQRVTGIVALLFIVWHVFHMHGWFHSQWWLEHVAHPWNGANFKPFNAASTLGTAMSSAGVQIVYAVGILSCVFHLANGLWTMGITWGLWISPEAQQRALRACAVLGVVLVVVGMGALVGAATVNVERAKWWEARMYRARCAAGEIKDNEEKRDMSDVRAKTVPDPLSEDEEGAESET